MSRRLAFTHLVVSSLLIGAICLTMFLAACESVTRADGRSGIALGVVMSSDDVPRGGGLLDWVLAIAGSVAAGGAVTGGGVAYSRARNRARCSGPASPVSRASEAGNTLVATRGGRTSSRRS